MKRFVTSRAARVVYVILSVLLVSGFQLPWVVVSVGSDMHPGWVLISRAEYYRREDRQARLSRFFNQEFLLQSMGGFNLIYVGGDAHRECDRPWGAQLGIFWYPLCLEHWENYFQVIDRHDAIEDNPLLRETWAAAVPVSDEPGIFLNHYSQWLKYCEAGVPLIPAAVDFCGRARELGFAYPLDLQDLISDIDGVAELIFVPGHWHPFDETRYESNRARSPFHLIQLPRQVPTRSFVTSPIWRSLHGPTPHANSGNADNGS